MVALWTSSVAKAVSLALAVIIGLLIVAVAIWAIVRVLEVIKLIPKTNQGDTNDVAVVVMETVPEMEAALASDPVDEAKLAALTNTPPPTNLFCVQYGVDSYTGPWVMAASQGFVINTNIQPVMVLNNTNQQVWEFNCEGNWFQYWYTWTNGVENDYILQVTAPFGTNGTFTLVIDRSPDLLNWEPAYTDQYVLPDNPAAFNETNGPMPAAFYRARLP